MKKRFTPLLLAVLQLVLGVCAAFCLLTGRTAGIVTRPSLYIFIALTLISLISGVCWLVRSFRRG